MAQAQEISREGAKNAKNRVVWNGMPTYKGANTRAVPLVRKEDVHHGRVFYPPSYINRNRLPQLTCYRRNTSIGSNE